MSSWPPEPESDGRLFEEFSGHAGRLHELVAQLNANLEILNLGTEYASLVARALVVIAENSSPQTMVRANQYFAEIQKLFPDLTKSISYPRQGHELAKQILDTRDAIQKSIRRPNSFGGIGPGFEASARVGVKKARRGRSE